MLFTKVISNIRAPLVRIPARNASIAEKQKRIKELQMQFSADTGVPVHLKGGPLDRVLFSGTLVLCAVGMGFLLKNLYVMAFPKKMQ